MAASPVTDLSGGGWSLIGIGAALGLLVAWDLTQRRHAILRNFPIIGHLRYLLEAIGPELRQYIVTDNDEERPFSRDQRRWVYASAKKQNNYFGFGTDSDLENGPHHLIVKHSAFPLLQRLPGHADYDPHHPLPCAKVIGAWRGREKAFRPESLVCVSAMSFGSLGAHAIEALNRGCAEAGCLHNTGEGGVSPHHLHGGELVWQIGTGYFGCRADDGGFSMQRLLATLAGAPVRALEVKLSQGAKPGLGGVLPGAKVTPEIARIRGVPVGKDVLSPSRHRAFEDVPSLVEFVESLGDATGLPVGIKSAVGDLGFWRDLADHMAATGRGPDYIAIDGGEGGTGAGPLVFADHVALPFKIAIARVVPLFAERGLNRHITFVGSGRLGFPEHACLAMALGCDLIAVAREAMLAVGCIQAQRCHTGHCPTGVATQSRWLQHGLVPTEKAPRLANYVRTLRKEMMWLARAAGVNHPALLTTDHFDLLDGCFRARSATEIFGYDPAWGLPGDAATAAVPELRPPPPAT